MLFGCRLLEQEANRKFPISYFRLLSTISHHAFSILAAYFRIHFRRDHYVYLLLPICWLFFFLRLFPEMLMNDHLLSIDIVIFLSNWYKQIKNQWKCVVKAQNQIAKTQMEVASCASQILHFACLLFAVITIGHLEINANWNVYRLN